MKLNYIILYTLFFVFGTSAVYAQWDTQISQYWRMKNFYNPSFIGENNAIEASLLHRRQWVGIENAPVTSLISLNMPVNFLGKEHGVGALVVNDKLGLFSNTAMMAQYTYKLKLRKDRYLNIGLQAGLMNINFDASGIKIPDDQKEDVELPAVAGDKKFDTGLGISWITPNYYIGVSATHLLEPRFDIDEEHSSYVARIYYAVGGYNIKLNNPLIELQPSVLFKSDAVTYQVDVTAKIEYNKMFNGGISWRKDDGFVFLLGVRIKSIDAGYSYDLSTSAISKVSNGSHELFIRYSMPVEKKKERHSGKSIRIL
ncbi:MAG: type IX secretion system membrane protein PorP/SprF [Prevotella sp.]|jgi:type IX secretion system PorP/SprF family membrane protein|nr:type IX secretion system membrane protein PorP/SprF [Prevotella sp.]